MPDSPSPFDDPFADLFGKLPDPRRRERRARLVAADAGHRSAAARRPPHATGPRRPPSRRAAREAAAQHRADRDRPAAREPPPRSPRRPRACTAPRAEPGGHGERARCGRRCPAADRVADPVVGARRHAVDHGAAAPTASGDLHGPRRSADEVLRHDLGDGRRRPKRRGAASAAGSRSASSCCSSAASPPAASGCGTPTRSRSARSWAGKSPRTTRRASRSGEALVTIDSGDTGGVDLAVALRRRRDQDARRLLRLPHRHRAEPAVRARRLPAAEADDLRGGARPRCMDPANKLENSALIREGLTVDQILTDPRRGHRHPARGLPGRRRRPCDYGVPVDERRRGGGALEGWLFPATYTFDPGVTATQVIQTLVDRTCSRSTPPACPSRIASGSSRSPRSSSARRGFETTSTRSRASSRTASIPSNQETFGKLADGLDRAVRLRRDARRHGRARRRRRSTTTTRGTRTCTPGLPIGPIANPGDVAIDAAMHPADGPGCTSSR